MNLSFCLSFFFFLQFFTIFNSEQLSRTDSYVCGRFFFFSFSTCNFENCHNLTSHTHTHSHTQAGSSGVQHRRARALLRPRAAHVSADTPHPCGAVGEGGPRGGEPSAPGPLSALRRRRRSARGRSQYEGGKKKNEQTKTKQK